MSSILKWMIVLLLLITVAGGGATYYCFIRSDEMLRAEVLKHLKNLAPDLTFKLDRARFDFSGRIRLLGLSIQLPGDVESSLYIQETIATLDDYDLTNFEKVSIRRLQIVHPQLRAIHQNGKWNWQGIAWYKDDSKAVPEIEIDHGTVVFELWHEHGPVRKLKMADLNLTAVPAAARKITAVVSARIESAGSLFETAGPLSATIDADLDSPLFKLEAKWLRLPVDDELLELAGELSPAVHQKLDDLRLTMAKLASNQVAATPIRPIRPGNGQEIQASPISLHSQIEATNSPGDRTIGLKCSCDLHCRLQLDERNSPVKYQVLADVRSGQFTHVITPFPLYEIQGSIYADPKQIIVRDLKAENGATRISVNSRNVPNESPRLKLQIRNVQIDESLTARLPESVRKHIKSLSLAGMCDLDMETKKVGDLITMTGDIRLSNGFISHEKFPYPINDVSGTIRLNGNRIDIDGQGKASGVAVQVKGWVLNPGPENSAEFSVQADAVPINQTLLKACPEIIRNALNSLKLQGTHDVRLQFIRAAGTGQKFRAFSAIRLRDCSCNLSGFPYRIHHLQGIIKCNEETITFQKLEGDHDETRLTAEGQFLRYPAPGRLELNLQAENAAFDRSLEAALPPTLKRLWNEFQPNGSFDVDSKITWIPQQPCKVELPRIKIRGAEITMRGFPWPMQGIEGEFAYLLPPNEPPRLVMKSVRAKHDDTLIRGTGVATFVAGESWTVRFDELHVDDLVPNSTFREALPPQLQRTFDALSPTGKFSIGTPPKGSVVFTGGQGSEGISATWEVQVLLAGSELSAGIRIHDIHGRIDLKGSNTGPKVRLEGRLDLDSISVFRQPSGLAHQISRIVGPFTFKDGQLTAGSRELATPQPSQRGPKLAERISGDAIDGKLTLDVVADLRDEPDYQMRITLARGRLESYAQQYLRGQSNLAGVMNGWLFLWGKGRGENQLKGRGELQIAPAALYELPVFVKIFSTLRLDAGDRTAFDRADVQYHIENSRFHFDGIDLTGPISLFGRGYINFDGAMQLDFYSMLARNQMRIPVLHEITGMLFRGWVGVKVSGHVGAPETRIVPVPEFDDALKQFLGTFEGPSSRSRSRSFAPR